MKQNGIMTLNNLLPPNSYDEKSPNGYGLLYTDTFEPADSSSKYTFRNGSNGVIITGTDGKIMENLAGPVIELWNIDVDLYPYIDVEINFDSGPEQISTPVFYGFMFGSEIGLTFIDLNNFRDFEINNGVWNFRNNSEKGSPPLIVEASDFIGQDDGYSFSKPIYGIQISGIPNVCNPDISINNSALTDFSPISQDILNQLQIPVNDISIKIQLNSDCDVYEIFISFTFGTILKIYKLIMVMMA